MRLPTPEEAWSLTSTWRKNPEAFFQDCLGIEAIWQMQADLAKACLTAIDEHKHIYVASGHSLGKDYICAALGLWFLHSFSPSIVIQTAPTERQVKKIMWGETLHHWHNRKIDFGGKAYRDPYLEIKEDSWYLIGFTTRESGASKKAQGGKFQGFHAPNVCVIVSEAQAVEDEIYDQIEGVTTAENNLVIFLGNPTRASGRFAKGLRDRENNIVFNFSCLENPNYKHKSTKIPGLTSYEWVENKRKLWGEDDPRWYGRVLGQVPRTSINNIFSQSDIDFMRKLTNCRGGGGAGVAIDVAGEGDDENVVYGGRNGNVDVASVRLNSSPGDNAINCQGVLNQVDGNFIIVDSDGVGIGTYQELAKVNTEMFHLIKFHGAGACSEKKLKLHDYSFQNLRAEAWFTAIERARAGKATIPDDPLLIEELLEVKFFENSRGKIQIEDKADLKDRMGRSPDKADAWVMLQWGFDQNYRELRREKQLEGNDRVSYGIPDQPKAGQTGVYMGV